MKINARQILRLLAGDESLLLESFENTAFFLFLRDESDFPRSVEVSSVFGILSVLEFKFSLNK
uniref:CSON008583 protein n=1 Tax=Culicoides sonorensis TaxID=179676 RepID=A0A336M4D1_CULSO